jgi:multiple sugar transport system permease protein
VTTRAHAGRAAIYAALVLAILIALFPFWWMIDTSLKRPVDIFSGVSLWPQHVTGSLVLGTLAAYGLARFRLRFGIDRLALYGVLLVRMLPGILLVIPLYIVLAKWGLLNTRLGLILIYAGLNTSFVVWMMQSFLEEIPRDIEEAAMVDGDSRLTALRRVVIPLAAPGLIATAIFAVIATYNDFIIARKIQIEWGPMAAAGVVGAMPIVLFALIVQRHFVRGLTLGAVK